MLSMVIFTDLDFYVSLKSAETGVYAYMPGSRKFILAGIDGGGSNTRAVVLDTGSKNCGIGFAGSSTFGVVAPETTQNSIRTALREAFSAAGFSEWYLDALYIGLGGVINNYEKTEMRRLIAQINLVADEMLQIDNDIKPALVGSLAGKPGICLLVGTGSVCFGIDNSGHEWRAGGWGEKIDDPGSGYFLGREALAATARAYDGRGIQSDLTRHLFARLGLADINEIVWKLSRMDRRDIAGLARDVLQYVNKGDEIALQILHRGTDELALMVAAVVSKLDFSETEIPLSTTGGVFKSGEIFKDTLLQKIIHKVPAVEYVQPLFPPVLGSLILAGRIAGIELTALDMTCILSEIKEYL